MTVNIKCSVCNKIFDNHDDYNKHNCTDNVPAAASGPEGYIDKYSKQGTGRP